MMKERIIETLKELIEGYKSRSLKHSPHTCPLCVKISCNNCPNLAFFSCTKRTRLYPKLDYSPYSMLEDIDEHINDDTLASFWQEVLDYVIASDETKISLINTDYSKTKDDVMNELVCDKHNQEYLAGIKLIAEKYK